MKDLKEYIRTIPDFPIKGIQFRDITTLIQNAEGFHLAIDKMCDMVKHLLNFEILKMLNSKRKMPFLWTICRTALR